MYTYANNKQNQPIDINNKKEVIKRKIWDKEDNGNGQEDKESNIMVKK